MKFEIAEKHTISTMLNIDYRYFHNTDANVLQKIASCKSVMEEDFTLILGWSSKVFTIISELVAANENQKKPRIVILSGNDKHPGGDRNDRRGGDRRGGDRRSGGGRREHRN